MPGAEKQVVWVKKILKQVVQQHEEKGMFVHNRDSGATSWLVEDQKKWVHQYPQLVIGASGQTLSVVSLAKPLAGQTCFWDLRVIQEPAC
eukprot:11181097-Lingulodinium_polyedra.AAC.1